MANKGVTIYFVRHGETYLNYYGRMQGWSNAPLTDHGIEDVRRCGRGLNDVRFNAVYTSDLTRTQETASLILEENGQIGSLNMVQMPEFREVFFGSMEGMYGSEAYEKVRDYLGYDTKKEMFRNTDVAERMNAFRAVDPEGHAEDFMMFWSRVEKGLIKLIDKHRDTGETILVVAHGGTIRYILENLIPELRNPKGLLNASVSVARYEDGLYHLEKYNDVSHFTD
ncbi:histidine phosphatase family protein [Alkalibacterium olivapovliticus]|uniref:Putative phosphoglycerate mutase n=1 Tax=Alkalibacterium olivapovliticus TaxID=99907 RepID=A0A2T0W7X6_9LACT|nr:histidine phosphatase family protein [Alkalibacterium olivapovliticus]PRY82634.1 putative phosphoglycerate mutase [Alkalibacterium olivapovliticus]